MGKKGNSTQKQATKKARQDTKQDKLSKKAGKIYGSDDIDAILADFAEQDRKKSSVLSDSIDEIPSRINAAFISHPLNDTIILHGGEHFNGNKVSCFKDIFVYNCAKNEYKQITAPNSPIRSGHTGVVVQADNISYLYMFAGDFTSPSQLFKHYNDIWVCNLATYQWEHLLGITHGPSIRSGHRMVVVKNKAIYVFGGFYDNHSSIKYFNDFFKFDLEIRKWERLGPGITPTAGKKAQMSAVEIAAASNAIWPSPRSGFGFLYHESTNSLLLYGGYCTAAKKNSLEESANVLSDLWQYSLNTNTWTPLKQSGYLPAGRSACSFFTSHNRILLFGGVKDVERKIETKPSSKAQLPENNQNNADSQDDDNDQENDHIAADTAHDATSATIQKKKIKKGKKGAKNDDDEFVLESEFYNELLEYSIKHKRWFKININVGLNPLVSKDTNLAPDSTELQEAPENEEEKKADKASVAWNWSSTKQQEYKLKEQQRLLSERRKQLEEEREAELLAMVKAQAGNDDDSDADLDEERKITPVNYLWPRRNAMITVKNGIAYMYGGAFERENMEIILNDLHFLDLKKMFKNVDLDKEYLAQQAIQQQTGSLSENTSSSKEVAGTWFSITDADFSRFSWFEEPDNDDDSDEEEEFDFSDDDGDDSDQEDKKSRVPSTEDFPDAKSYFKSDEQFWISEALSTAPDGTNDKALRQLGFQLAKQYYALRSKQDE